MSDLTPSEIKLHSQSRLLEVTFNDRSRYELPCEYLRVYSSAADVKVAKNNGEVIAGKEKVGIKAIDPVGQYAVRLHFSDGHKGGVYSWEYLKDLGEHQQEYWQQYLQDLANAGQSRTPTR